MTGALAGASPVLQGGEDVNEEQLPRGVVPSGTYARGGRSPVVYVFLCPVCAGYAPTVPEDYPLYPTGAHCQGCGSYVREVHRFQALIMSAANGGCMCITEHPQVTGDLPTEESALAVWTEVKTRPTLPGRWRAVADPRPRNSPAGMPATTSPRSTAR